MEIFNIGPLELILVLLIMFFLLGPKGMILTAQKIGQWIRGLVKSDVWKEIMGYSQEIRELPKKIMDDTGLKEALDDVQQTTKATAAELNATVNEAVQAARVPEAEHIRINTIEDAFSPVPAAGTVQADPEKPAGEENSRQSYPLPTAGESQTAAAAVVAKGSSEELESSPAVTPDEKIKPRRRSRVRAGGEAAVAVDGGEKPLTQRRSRGRKPVQAEETPAPSENAIVEIKAIEGETAAADHVLEESETPAPRTRRPRVKKPSLTVDVEAAPLEAVEAEKLTGAPIADLPAAGTGVTPGGPDAGESAAPRTRGSRGKKPLLTVESEAAPLEAVEAEKLTGAPIADAPAAGTGMTPGGPDAGESAAPHTRRPRTKKMTEPPAEAETVSTSADELHLLKNPRQRRAGKPGSGNGAQPEPALQETPEVENPSGGRSK